MHDGSLATLDDVVEHYSTGGNLNPNSDPTIQPLNLTAQEKADLVAFLQGADGRHPGDQPKVPALSTKEAPRRGPAIPMGCAA